ncbi:MAG: hypothetical protein AUI36_27185 [Cyanobacteria bacterium 13_1_40CM_2_61_4]|nr:MAG: hypothetical protein AUI36_27185 [Cyanobacteria bacterium 13_1_40CM_2_61_4]
MAEVDTQQTAAVPPLAQLADMIFGKAQTHLLFVAAKLGIADLLQDGPKPVADLAKATNAHVPSLYRALRALAGMGVFAETEPGYFTLTSLADLLRTDAPSSLKGLALMAGSDWHNRAWAHLFESVQTGKSYFATTYGMHMYEYLRQHPADQDNLAEAMASMSQQDAVAVCTGYDFSAFHTLVDVGGGTGYFLAALLKTYPTLKGILLDQPGVADQARARIKAEGLDDRCEVIGGDFFHSVPRGGDGYTIKGVIENWDDERAGTILTNCREAMNPEGRVLVIGMVIPPGNTPSLNKVLDMEMLAFLDGGVVRTEAEFQALFSRAGLKISRVLSIPSPYSIIEGVPV